MTRTLIGKGQLSSAARTCRSRRAGGT